MSFFDKFKKTSTRESSQEVDIKSIVENLNNILNTKQGFGSFLEGFGIRDLSECNSREKLGTAILEEVTNNIERFEPRLKIEGITITKKTDAFRIAFKIEGKIKNCNRSLQMEFNTLSNNFYVQD